MIILKATNRSSGKTSYKLETGECNPIVIFNGTWENDASKNGGKEIQKTGKIVSRRQ